MRRRRRLAIGALALAVVIGAGCLGLWWSLPDVRNLARDPPESTAFIDRQRREAEESGQRFVLRWTWRPLGRISPFLRQAVVHAEDAKFWDHEGVDWDAIEHAAEKNWDKGRFAVGGSTITQQVAKNLYLSPSKNPLRKLRELLIARRLEAHLTKERILEIYLNIAEWGDGVFGAEAAARRWFGCSAAELRPVQAGRLAVALPNPRQRAPSVHSRELNRKVGRLVQAMQRTGLIDDDALTRALTELGLREPEPVAPADTAPAIPPDPVPPAEPDPVPASDSDAAL
jgi:monofunctional biosynthetic peptidoglycan transglycosylase